jgi:micrococcal nuclease
MINKKWVLSHKRQAVKMAVMAVCVIACVVAISFAIYTAIRGHNPSDPYIDPEAYYPVIYVVDGDTFKVDVGETDDGSSTARLSKHISRVITIRVLGINTPETVDPRKPMECYGQEASVEAKKLLTNHKVKLTFNPNRELKDKYGRYLAYVYLDNGLFYNESMIKNGYAREYTFGTPYLMQKDFRNLEWNARTTEAGLWNVCK